MRIAKSKAGGVRPGSGRKKGSIPWNKGLKGWHEGTNAGFQKGHVLYEGAEKGWFTFDRVGGEKNINWKDGKTADREKYPAVFRRISKQIIQEDNFICQICDIRILEQTKYQHLVVHHIDKNVNNNNRNNLITLCNSCHRKIHHKTAQIPVVQEVQ